MSADTLDVEAIAVSRALGGDVDAVTLLRAHVEATGGEHRDAQEDMTRAVEEAIASERPLLAQAGTGTGKSLAYAFALAAAGTRAVIATATNQLSEQLIRHDLPQVADTLAGTGARWTFAMLKGRNQYVCLARVAELASLDARAAAAGVEADQDSLFTLDTDAGAPRKADAAALRKVIAWSKKTTTGDRSDAPAVPDRVWSQVSVTPADCAGASCPFYDPCFTERARKAARTATIVVTNHALLAHDLKAAVVNPQGSDAPTPTVFGPHAVVVVDECHEFPDAVTSALSSEVSPAAIAKWLAKAARHVDEETSANPDIPAPLDAAAADLTTLTDVLAALGDGPVLDLPEPATLALGSLSSRLIAIQRALLGASAAASRGERTKAAVAAQTLAGQAGDLIDACWTARATSSDTVRWVDRSRRDGVPVLRTAPLDVGPALEIGLGTRTLVGTSATLTVGSDFTPLQRSLGLAHARTLDVGSPFDYPSQGMLYVPARPFPEPVGRDRTEHTAAVLTDLTALVTAAGGRTLALFTTTAGALRAAEHLRVQLPHLRVLAHGDAPADQLVQAFKEEETSVLCATMGMWHGVNVPGASCTLVVIDKVGFAPVDDVLSAARRKRADEEGRDGFTDVVVGQAAISLAQAAGRLIRTADDKGVVAILDPRLRTKGYGKTLLASLPPFRVFSDRALVEAALTRLTGGTSDTDRASRPAPAKRPRTPRRAGATRAVGQRKARR